jgi:hypothetical protein
VQVVARGQGLTKYCVIFLTFPLTSKLRGASFIVGCIFFLALSSKELGHVFLIELGI